jgi:hypothetical protein
VPAPPPADQRPDSPLAVWEAASPKNFQPWTDPAPRGVDMVVIHDIEGSAISAVRWFQNEQAQASSHYVIDGETGKVYQMVKEKDVAWHAGNRDTNRRSVGIEHHGYAYRPGYYDATLYESSARLVREITARYSIPRDRTHIIGHFEVPDPANPGQFGGRSHHTDPGPYWDWDAFMALVRSDAQLAQPAAPPPVHPGEKVTVTISATNYGDDPWPGPNGAGQASADSATDAGRVAFAQRVPVYLGAWPVPSGIGSGDRPALWDPKDWTSPRLVGLPQGGLDVAPNGGAATFSVTLTAPPVGAGEVTQRFRLFHVPPAPRAPFAFGPVVPVTLRVEPYELAVSAGKPGTGATFAPGAAWQRKGDIFWAKAAPSVAPARWTATLPQGGVWEVYARWPAASGRTAAAQYTVSAGTAPGQAMTVDQREAPAGVDGWHLLGRFPLGAVGAKNVAAAVELAARGKGVAVADAVRFVGPYAPEAGDKAP